MLDYDFDRQFLDSDDAIICGTDEAGRGPLAGPVVAGAVILPKDIVIEGLDDSKKLTEKKRERLYGEICEKCIAWAAGSASEAEIDEINILNASQLAMRRAVASLGITPTLVLVDGNVSRGFNIPTKTVIGGDAVSQSIAAASVIAKVTRDRLCADMDREYPQYGFAAHKGYPTKAHKLAIYRYGASPIHRKSFLSFLVKDHDKLAGWDEEERARGDK